MSNPIPPTIPDSGNYDSLSAQNITVQNQYINNLVISNLITDHVNTNHLNTDTLDANTITTDTINGIFPQAHASRHAFDGADPLTPAASSDISELSDFISSSGSNDTKIPRADHVHAHGNRGGGTLHAEATPISAGFMSAADKTKIDGLSPSDQNPQNLGTTSPGISTEYSRSDHVHAHGNQAGGLLHAVATESVAGFLSAVDKIKLDNIPAGANTQIQFNDSGVLGSSVDLTYNKTTQTLSAPNYTGNFSIDLPSGEILVGSALNKAAPVAMSGDATINNTGVLTLANVNASPGSTTLSSITTDSKGLVTNNTNATLTDSKFWLGNISNVPTEVSLSGDATMNDTGAVTLATVNVSPGSTTLSSVTTNAKGLVTANTSATLADANIWIGSSLSVPTAHTISGDATLANTGALTLATVNASSGSTTLSSITTNSKGLVTSNTNATLTDSKFWLGNISNVPTEVSLSGDATMNDAGALTLATVNGAPGSTTLSSVTTNAKGLVTSNTSATLADANIWIGNGSSVPTAHTISGDATMSDTGALTLATVNAGPGSTTLSSVTTNAKGLVTSNTSATLADSKFWVGNVSSVPTAVSMSGDATLSDTGALTLATVNASSGSTTLSSVTTNAKGLVISNTSATLADTNIWIGNGSSVPTAHAISGDAIMSDTGVLTLATVPVTKGGTGLTSAAQGDLIYGSGVNTLSTLAKNTTASRYLSNSGTTNNPAWAQVDLTNGVTGVLPSANGGTGVNNGSNTLTLGGNLTTSGAFNSTFTMTGTTNVTFPTSGTLATTTLVTPAALTKADDTNVTLTLGGTPSTALLQASSITAGWTGTLSGARGGTGVANTGKTITLGGNLTTSGAFDTTLTTTALTSVTLPTSGTLATTSQLPTPAALTKTDDTNVTLTLGGTPSTALLQAASITAGWTGQLGVTRGGTGLASTAQGDLLYSSAANTISALAKNTTASRYLSNSGTTNNPAWSQVDLTNGVTGVLPSANGGTGVNNGSSTLTLGGNLTTSGAFNTTLTSTATTSVTLPTSGTLATTSQLPTPAALTKTDDTNVTLTLGGTPSTALLQAASITAGWTGTLSGDRGGTGVANTGKTITLGGNLATSGAFNTTLTTTATTSVTLPTSGTLATTSQLPTPAALTKTDDTNVTLTLGGTPSTALLQAASITAGWTGQLGVTRGGTGLASTAQGDLLYSSAANTISALAKDTNTSRYLSNSGTTNNPAWSQVDLSNGVTGNLPVTNLNSGTAATSTSYWTGSGTWTDPITTRITGTNGLTVSTATSTATVGITQASFTVQYLVIGGGASGFYQSSASSTPGQGGAAGQLIASTQSLSVPTGSNTYTFTATVGAGSPGNGTVSGPGGASSLTGPTGFTTVSCTGGATSTSANNNGGANGAGTAGGTGTVPTTGGNGAAAISNSITGSAVNYAAGGGGAGNPTGGTGGSGAGNGSNHSSGGSNATGYGSGGGAGIGNQFTSGDGFQGVVIVRIPTSLYISSTGVGTVVTTVGTDTVVKMVLTGATVVIGYNKTGLSVPNDANIYGNVRIQGSNSSTSTTTGALIVDNGLGIGGKVYTGGALNVTDTTTSTSTSTGSIIASGGVGIAGKIYTGGALNVTDTTTSTSTSTGSIIASGGVGIAGNTYIGGYLKIPGRAFGYIFGYGGQSLNNNWEVVLDNTYWNTGESQFNGSITWTNGAYKVPRTGMYLITFGVNFGNNTSGQRYACLYYNGSYANRYAFVSSAPDASGHCALTSSLLFPMNTNDTVAVNVLQGSGTTITMDTGTRGSFCIVEMT